MQSLESRVLFSVDTSSVALYTASGQAGATIEKHMALFVLVHGDESNESDMVPMALSVEAQLPANQYQVLILDWSQIASSLTNAYTNAVAVGGALATMIKTSRIPISRVNLIGFSMGGTVISGTAKDLQSRRSKVNLMVGIDPATQAYLNPDFAGASKYSICFCGNDTFGQTVGSLSADDAVLLTGLPSDQLDRHVDVFSVVSNMWQQDIGNSDGSDSTVASLFSIPSLLHDTKPLDWKEKGFYDNWEAIMACGGDSDDPVAMSLSYVDVRNHTVTIE